MALTTLISDQLKGNATQRFQAETDDITSSIRKTLKSPDACLQTLNGVTLNGATNFTINNIRDDSGVASYTAGTTYNNRGTRYLGAILHSYQEEKAPEGRALLTLKFESVAPVFGASEVERTIQVNTTKNESDDSLVACGSRRLQDEGLFQTAGGGGKIETSSQVGIGTDVLPSGVALSVKNGYIHAELDCRMVESTSTPQKAVARCGDDEFLVSGGGRCADPGVLGSEAGGFIHLSEPTPDMKEWQVDCFQADYAPWAGVNPPDLAEAWSYAICCKQ